MAFEVKEPTLWQEPVSSSTRAQADLLQNLPGGPKGYRLRRIILTNFWLYEQQEFEIPHGRLFLAGENASGKSTVLIAAIPLVLDGNFRPERIDTFGKREKRIDYYIIGSKESATPFTRDQRTSYVALEFEWCDMDKPPFVSELRALWERGESDKARFLTLGLAFNGNRNRATPIDAMHFLITDGSRLGIDIPTVQETKDGPRAIDIKTFRKTLGQHGIICESPRDYEQKVALALFNSTNLLDYRRLIRQLLYLRQPNLNSVLSLETVRNFLDQSLPHIPVDLVYRAATTLELMDTLREEIERRRKAYSATEQLHRGQEASTIARVRQASCDYVHSQFQEDKEQANIRRLKTNLTRASNDIGRIDTRITELERELDGVTGEIHALQGSKGLQAAQQLSEVGARVKRLESELAASLEILNDTIGRREEQYERIATYARRFHEHKRASVEQVRTISVLAQREAVWDIAAEQLAAVEGQLQSLTLEDSSPHITITVAALTSAVLEERLSWLQGLRERHRQIERELSGLQAAQKLEQQYYDELDSATRQFEHDREQVCGAQQELADLLDQAVEESDQLSATHFSALHERGAWLCNEAQAPREIVEQFSTLLVDYSSTIGHAVTTLETVQDHVQAELDALRGQRGGKEKELEQVENEYQQKLQEPEYIPPRSAHRLQARQRLAEHNIPALPLYTLIDFAPAIDSESAVAGGIEYMLEDAGLLDALVVLPTQQAAADALLKGEGLSDCRLDSERLAREYNEPGGDAGENPEGPGTRQVLCIDSAIGQTVREEPDAWQQQVQAILEVMARTVYAGVRTDNPAEIPGNWQHGLLRGQAGPGTARCIGKATRVREQQRALALLRQRRDDLARDLQAIVQRIERAEQQISTLKNTRDLLSGALRESGIEGRYNTLQSTLDLLERTQERYNQARQETQTLRSRLNVLRVELQRECRDNAIFASDQSSVEKAYTAVTRLQSDYKDLRRGLEDMLGAWREQKRATEKYEQAKGVEARAATAHKNKERETQQARSELETLQGLVATMEGLDVHELYGRLQALQERHEALPELLRKEREARIRVETTLGTTQDELQRAQAVATEAQRKRLDAFTHFAAALSSYPIEILLIASRDLQESNALEKAQEFLHEPLTPDEESYLARKVDLDDEKSKADNTLYTTYSEVANLLHEYGPYLEEGLVHFRNMDQATPFELLGRLGEEINQQERLLDEKERELFKDFLLKEMADTVRKHILDAEAWVDRINKVLKGTLFIDERYSLKWVIKEYDQGQQGQPGRYLAQHHALLRRQAQTFKDEEIATLVRAFRQEIDSARANQEATGTPFVDMLGLIFDYRTWFRFEIYAGDQHLSDRLLKKRSGAEQYVALYVPFFAALSALYESAGEGAPRLIALDEAFDKVSIENTRRLLNFLASQQFQWIMTGPRVTGEGTEIPACVRYLMLHQKGSELATGFPSFWSGQPQRKPNEEG